MRRSSAALFCFVVIGKSDWMRKRKVAICLGSAAVIFAALWLAIVAVAEAPGTTTIHLVPQRQFTLADKIDPRFWLGNADDPLPPVDYLVGDADRIGKWYWRNPFHNFTFYVMGIADQAFDRQGWLPADVFNESGGWNFTVCKFGPLRLPFVSYKQGKLQCYWGWRSRGNFGIKFNA
jgi:hypothetical protein